MSWAEIFDEESFSVGIAPQGSGINTPGTVWTWIDCEMPQVSYDAAQTDTKRSRRSRGSGTKRRTGRVHPRVAIRFPMVGQLADFDHTSDTPALEAANKLLDFLGGSSGIAYQASGMSPVDGGSVSLITSTGKVGCLVAGVESTGAVLAKGFIQSLSGAGPYTAALFEDLAAEPGTSIGRIPTLTIYPSTTAPTPITIRVNGEHADMARAYIGCVLSKATMTFDSDWRPYWNCEFVAYGGEDRTTYDGGLMAVTECLPLEPLVSRGGARFVIGSNVVGTLADGTVDPDGTCDVRDFELSWEFPHYATRCPTGTEGVGQVVVRSPMQTISFSLPDISDFEVSSEHMGEAAWRNLTEISVSLYLGDTPGQIFAANIPRMIMTAYPEVVMVDGARHRRFVGEAGHYAGDGASTDAGNKSGRYSWG